MFLEPNKYMDLKICTLKVSSEIIKYLLKKKKHKIKYSSLNSNFYSIYGEDCNYIIIPAINFLYLVGKLNYIKKKDELELIK